MSDICNTTKLKCIRCNPGGCDHRITKETDESVGAKFNKEDLNTIDDLIEYWNSSLPSKVDYADLVGAEVWARGYRYVYEDEYGYMIEDTIKMLEKIKENKNILCI